MMAIEKTTVPAYKEITREGTKMESSSQTSDQTIHSGHFMITNVHRSYEEQDEEYEDEDVIPKLEEDTGYDFQSASQNTSSTYSFGPKFIDQSLTKLFDCMSLAYSGKLTSPKWKAFRGLHLTVKDKVRLNNIIWREWCMQYIYGLKPIVCQFASPLSDDIHTKPEAIVLEGKYWKRRLDTVTAEYKRFRKFYKNRLANRFVGDDSSSKSPLSNAELLARVGEVAAVPTTQHAAATDLLLNSTDFMDIDFSSDSLFSTLNQPFAFPNPRELSGVGMADLMQPGLVPLQPNLEDYMDTYDPITEMLTARSQSNNVLYFTGNQLTDSNSATVQANGTSNNFATAVSDSKQQQPMSPNDPTSSASLGNLLSGLLGSITSTSIADGSGNNTAAQLLAKLQENAQAQQTQTPQQTNQQSLFFLPENEMPQATLPQNLPSNSVINTLNTNNQNKVKKVSSLQEALLGNNPVVTNQFAKTVVTQGSKMAVKSKSVPEMAKGKKTTLKKDGNFVKPVGKPATTRPKQRMIAPATTSQSSTQNTYLAQLLTTGTYPGAIINVKKEVESGSTPSLVTLQQSQQTTPSSIVVSPLNYKIPEISTGLLLQSPSQGADTTATPVKDVLGLVAAAVSLPTNKASTLPTLGNVSNLAMSPSISSTQSSQDSVATRRSSYPPSSPKTSNPTSPSDIFSVASPKFNQSFDSDNELKGDQSRQLSHASAEQKRRCNIKSGFDLLHTLIPALSQNPNAKISKAAMLQKTAEYCKKLKSERTQMQNEAEILRQEIESLNVQISQCQSQLPATGVPVTRQRVDQMKDMFQEYVKKRTLQNWKFWIFSTIIRGLFDTYNNMVSTASMEELCRTTLAWLDQHCSLVALRPAVLNALRHLSTTTSILSDPSRMPEQATEAVIKSSKTPDT